jgi:hypothetical protein
MNTLDIACKDIQQILRDWKSALFLIVMPILFTIFFGLVFGPVLSGDQKSDPRLPVGWINQDPEGLLSDSLKSLLASSEVIRPVPLEGADPKDLVAKGELAHVRLGRTLRIPTQAVRALLGL